MSETEGLVKLSIDNVHKNEINVNFVIKSLIYDAISEKHLCTLMSTCGHFAFFACSRKKILIQFHVIMTFGMVMNVHRNVES